MARIRYLKPEFFSDEDLCELKYETRITFEGLWCYADKAGRLEDRPKFLKAMIFPYDNIDMEKQLDALSKKPFITRYEVDGKRLIQIIHWDKHQKPHHTEADSKFPPSPPLKEKGMGMGMEKQLNPSEELRNGEITVNPPLECGSYNNDKDKVYGEFKNVKLTDDEFQKLISKYGEPATKEKIESLSEGIASKGYKYKSHYATILSWDRKNGGGYKKPEHERPPDPKPVFIKGPDGKPVSVKEILNT